MEKLDGDVPQANQRAVFTKMDLIKKVSAAVDITQKDAEIVTETILNAIVRTLRAGEKGRNPWLRQFPHSPAASAHRPQS